MSGSIAADRTNQVAVTATPVITSNEVYDAYLQFLSLPGSLQTSCDPPPPSAAQIWRQYGDVYYWVPLEYRAEFLKLSLATTVQRGKPLFTADEFFTVTFKEVTHEEPGQFDNAPKLTIALDKKIPADSGYAKVMIAGVEVQYVVQPPDNSLSQTNEIVLTLDPSIEGSPKTVAAFKGKLPLQAKVYLRYNQPKPPTTDDLLQRVNFQLQLIQFNQLRSSASGF
jgi:hypothetical protein